MDIYTYLKIDASAQNPIYRQLIEGMEKYCGGASAGSPIPPERDLCGRLKVSRTILRQALDECVRRGLFVRQWGKGTFVGGAEHRKRFLVVTTHVTTPNIANPTNYILPGIEARARELSIQLEMLPDVFIYDKPEQFVTDMLERENFTGILYLSYICGLEPPAMEAFRKTRTPLYWPHVLDTWAAKERFYCGCVDTRKTFLEALQILVDSGARRIVTIAFPDIALTGGIRGYSAAEFLALEEQLGVEPDPDLILVSPYDKASIFSAMDSLIQKRKSFDAVLCVSDFYAIHAMSWLKEHHFRIPDDVAVMGYCGYPGGQFLDPPLSTIDYHYYEIGYHAVDRLLEIAALGPRKLPPGGVVDVTPCTARIRESTRPAGKHGTACRVQSAPTVRNPKRRCAGILKNTKKTFSVKRQEVECQ